MTPEELIQARIQYCHSEIEELELIKSAMNNETAKEAIDLHVMNLRTEILRLKEFE
ncbi:antitoxin [Enterococcus sp. DIV0996a]|uniref:antitoxin n=1 Tax=unclassified Enterococcus TaxID=2608891 RepID=UPI003F258EC8